MISFPEPTEEIIRAAKDGDMEAWRSMYERYRNVLKLLVRSRVPASTRRRYDADDALQSAFLSAFREIDSYEYRGEGSFLAWITQILQRRIASRTRRVEDLAAHQSGPVSVGPDSGPSPSEACSRAEQTAHLLQAMGDLPERERQVLTLRFFDKQTIEQIATEMGVSQSTVSRLLERGVLLLKPAFSPRDPEAE